MLQRGIHEALVIMTHWPDLRVYVDDYERMKGYQMIESGLHRNVEEMEIELLFGGCRKLKREGGKRVDEITQAIVVGWFEYGDDIRVYVKPGVKPEGWYELTEDDIEVEYADDMMAGLGYIRLKRDESEPL